MTLRVCERQRRTPGAAEHQPLIDAQVLAQCFHVSDEMPRRVVDEAGMRAAATAAALVEQDDAIRIRIEETARAIVTARARAAVHEQGWLARGIATLLVIDLMLGRDPQVTRIVRLDGWV